MAEQELSFSDYDSDCDEEVTKEKLSDSDSVGSVPAGKYLCVIEKTALKSKTRKSYVDGVMKEAALQAVNITFRVVKALEVEGVVGEFPEMTNKKIFDTMDLFVAGENETFATRRVFFLKRAGAIKAAGERITRKMWEKDILGRQIIVIVVLNKWVDKATKEKKEKLKVDLYGYDFADAAATQATDTEDYSDV